MVYDLASYSAVMALLGSGLSDYKIAERTGVKRGTVRNWRRALHPPQTVERDQMAASWDVPDGASYCYLLGAYLGDGTINVQRGVWLQIVNDRRYPGISRESLRRWLQHFRVVLHVHTRLRSGSRTFCASAIRRCCGHFRSTELAVSTCARSC
jgi:hypothetical protein